MIISCKNVFCVVDFFVVFKKCKSQFVIHLNRYVFDQLTQLKHFFFFVLCVNVCCIFNLLRNIHSVADEEKTIFHFLWSKVVIYLMNTNRRNRTKLHRLKLKRINELRCASIIARKLFSLNANKSSRLYIDLNTSRA